MAQTVTADPAGIAVKGHARWAAIAGEEMHHRFQSGLRMKIRAGLGHEPGGGSGVHKITDFHDVLPLAIRIRWHAGRILEIELDLFHGLGTILRSVMATRRIQDTSELAQDAPDGACRAGKGQALRLQLLVAMQVIQNRPGTWCRLPVLRRVLANLFNPLDDTRMDLWIGGVMGTRAREQHLQIIWGSISQSLQPLFDPAQGAAHRLSQILLGPLGMFTGQTAQRGPIGDPIDFHSELSPRFLPSV